LKLTNYLAFLSDRALTAAHSLPQGATSADIRLDIRFWHIADIATRSINVRFSNRPVGVKRFQTIHDCGIDVTRGLVLLYGIGT
jgi:hypothetical protein